MRLTPLVALAVLAGCHSSGVAPVQDGRAVLQRMHDHYAGRWYNTLTFKQNTLVARPNGVTDTAIWYESLKGPHWLRIDQGSPSIGNGVLYTADSLYVVRNGNLARALPIGNPFIPLIMGVYLQPLDQTVSDLASYHFDLGKVSEGELDGRPAWVVGTNDAADSTVPQFWVDKDRLILLRMRVGFGPGGPLADAHLLNNVQTGGGWLATRVEIHNGATTQSEEYFDWHTGMDLPDALFDVRQWKTAAHWAH